MRGWRKAGGFVLMLLLDAFTVFEITWEHVALYSVFAGANAAVKFIAERAK